MLTGLHAVAAVAWVGGIFFAFMALRPASETLEPPLRLKLWRETFARFFPWVWLFIVTLLVTGYADLFIRFGGFAEGKIYLHTMHAIGIVMTVLFTWLYIVPYRKLCTAIDAGDIPAAAAAMKGARPVMIINLTLGLLNSFIGVACPFIRS